jgi:hypothetical protein
VDDNPRAYDRLALRGFVHVVVGTFYQVAANWL